MSGRTMPYSVSDAMEDPKLHAEPRYYEEPCGSVAGDGLMTLMFLLVFIVGVAIGYLGTLVTRYR